MPLPITFDTTTDAASIGPSRRSRVAEDGALTGAARPASAERKE
jgi:hypothetical protein